MLWRDFRAGAGSARSEIAVTTLTALLIVQEQTEIPSRKGVDVDRGEHNIERMYGSKNLNQRWDDCWKIRYTTEGIKQLDARRPLREIPVVLCAHRLYAVTEGQGKRNDAGGVNNF